MFKCIFGHSWKTTESHLGNLIRVSPSGELEEHGMFKLQECSKCKKKRAIFTNTSEIKEMDYEYVKRMLEVLKG